MVNGGGRGGRGGGWVGAAGSHSALARKLTAAEELERDRRASDAARIGGSYRYLHHGMKLPCAFARCESQFYWDLEASRSRIPPPRRSSCSEASSSSASRRLTFIEGSISSASAPEPQFDQGDYTEDNDIPTLAAKFELAAPALMAGDFVPDSALGMVTKLVEEQSHRDAEKKEEWLREHAAQDANYIEIDDID